MMRLYTTIIMLFFSMVLFAQSDYQITNARKVKTGYKVYPRDVRSEPLKWTGLSQSCLERVQYGNWFDLKLKSDRIQFTVHTGGRFGDLEDPGFYLGTVEESRNGRALVQVKCEQLSGNDGQFNFQAVKLDPEATYYLLVTAPVDGLFYSISTTDNFEEVDKESTKPPTITAAFQKIFGRVSDRSGKGVSGVEVTLLDEAQNEAASTSTDAEGMFDFQELPSDKVYLTRVETEDTELQIDMFLLDEKGTIVNRSSRIDGKLYGFGAREDAFPQLNLLTARDWKAVPIKLGKIAILGKVVDRATYLRGQAGIKVGLYDKDRTLLQTSETDQSGYFRFSDLDKQEYDVKLEVRDEDYAEVVLVDDLLVPYASSSSKGMDADGFFVFQQLPADVIRLQRMEAKDTSPSLMPDFSHMEDGQPIVLRNILFPSGSSELLVTSHRDLDALAAELNGRDEVKIEVSGHTDNQGNASTNRMLSKARARAVVDYLVAQGVSVDRLQFKGYGEERPIATNDTEEGRKRNRRVEFVVID